MKKILLIEDEEDLLDGLSLLLGYEGFNVLISSNGTDGITIANKELPDLILCDILMPGTDGFGVLSQLKSNKLTSSIPFIFITAFDETAKRRQGMKLGADDFLVKPFSRQELVDAINVQLKKHDAIENKQKEILKNIICSITHQCKEPLNSIIGFSQIIKEKTATLSSDEITQMGQYIYDSSHILNDIIQKYNILMEVELHNHTKKFHTEYQIPSVIKKITNNIAQTFNRPVHYELDTESCRINIIGDWFFFILKELINFAFRFSENGNSVLLKSKKNNNILEIYFCWKGQGFSTEDVHKINVLSTPNLHNFQFEGIGLDLYLSRRIVEIHRGTLTINRSQAKDNEIFIQLPCTE